MQRCRKTALNDFFSTDDTLRYDSGELSFEIKLMGLKGSDFPYAHLEDGEGKILCEMCGGIYGQLMVQEALTKYPNEPIAQYARKMLKKKETRKSIFLHKQRPGRLQPHNPQIRDSVNADPEG